MLFLTVLCGFWVGWSWFCLPGYGFFFCLCLFGEEGFTMEPKPAPNSPWLGDNWYSYYDLFPLPSFIKGSTHDLYKKNRTATCCREPFLYRAFFAACSDTCRWRAWTAGALIAWRWVLGWGQEVNQAGHRERADAWREIVKAVCSTVLVMLTGLVTNQLQHTLRQKNNPQYLLWTTPKPIKLWCTSQSYITKNFFFVSK